VTYTQLVLVALAGSVVLDLVVLRTRLLGRRSFWVAYVIVLAFQLLTNGWLTGRGIVTYSAVRSSPKPRWPRSAGSSALSNRALVNCARRRSAAWPR